MHKPYRVVAAHMDVADICGTGVDPEYILDILPSQRDRNNPAAVSFEFDMPGETYLVSEEVFSDLLYTYGIRSLWENNWNTSDICMFFVQRYIPSLDKWENVYNANYRSSSP